MPFILGEICWDQRSFFFLILWTTALFDPTAVFDLGNHCKIPLKPNIGWDNLARCPNWFLNNCNSSNSPKIDMSLDLGRNKIECKMK